MPMSTTSLRLRMLVSLALVCPGFAHAQPPSAESVVRSFHDALRTGDAARVKQLLAPDAVIIEAGHLESREEYLSHHLSADIEFAKSVPSQLLSSRTTVHGATAWVQSATSSTGSFRDQAVKLVGAELVVLTRAGSSWEIRAIHWSSYKPK